MQWSRKYMMILLKAGLRVPLLKGYVDDGRQGGTVLRKGMLFDDSMGEFRMDDEQLRKDQEEKLPDNVRMAKVCLPTMNHCNKDLHDLDGGWDTLPHIL